MYVHEALYDRCPVRYPFFLTLTSEDLIRMRLIQRQSFNSCEAVARASNVPGGLDMCRASRSWFLVDDFYMRIQHTGQE